jgi:O-antigen/teichoic acid export membrane protein
MAESTETTPAWRNALFNVASYAWPLLLMLVSTPWLVGSLGEGRYGTWLIASALLSLSGFAQFGLNDATTFFVAKHEGEGDRQAARQAASATVCLYALGGALCAAVIFLSAGPIVTLLVASARASAGDSEEARALVRIVAWAFPLALVHGGVAATGAGLQRYQIPMVMELVRATLWTALAVGAASLGLPLEALAAGTLAAYACSLLVGWAMLARARFALTPTLPRASLVASMLRYGGWTWAAGLSSMAFGVLDRLLLGALLGQVAVTHYAVPQALARRIPQLAHMVSHVIFPMVGARRNDPAALERVYVKGHAAVLWMLGSLTAGALVAGDAVLELWMGSAFAKETALPLRLIVVTVCLGGLNIVPYYTLLGVGRPRTVAVVTFAAGILFLGCAALPARVTVASFAATSLLFAGCNVMHFFAAPSRSAGRRVAATTLGAGAVLALALAAAYVLRALLGGALGPIATDLLAGAFGTAVYLGIFGLLMRRRADLWPASIPA